jgi:uncharacterized membrane protein
MSKFVVIVFSDEEKAYQGTRELTEIHAEGSLTLYGMAVITKDAQGNISVKEAADTGPLGAGVGALVGGLMGVIGGPVGVLAGAAGGTLLGSFIDLFNYGVGEDFIMKVSEEMQPGRIVAVAEVAETWTTPLDARMEKLGATVLRTWRDDFEDEQIARETAARRADFEMLQAEYAQASAEAKAKLKGKLDQAKADLQRAEQRLKSRVDALGKEANARIAALEKQITDARADAKEKVRQRVGTLRADYETRSAKLQQAWTLTKEALAA